MVMISLRAAKEKAAAKKKTQVQKAAKVSTYVILYTIFIICPMQMAQQKVQQKASKKANAPRGGTSRGGQKR